jgi:hypothetical protein
MNKNAYVWNQGWRGNRKITYTGNRGRKYRSRYVKFLGFCNKLLAGATFVIVVKVLVMMFGV